MFVQMLMRKIFLRYELILIGITIKSPVFYPALRDQVGQIHNLTKYKQVVMYLFYKKLYYNLMILMRL